MSPFVDSVRRRLVQTKLSINYWFSHITLSPFYKVATWILLYSDPLSCIHNIFILYSFCFLRMLSDAHTILQCYLDKYIFNLQMCTVSTWILICFGLPGNIEKEFRTFISIEIETRKLSCPKRGFQFANVHCCIALMCTSVFVQLESNFLEINVQMHFWKMQYCALPSENLSLISFSLLSRVSETVNDEPEPRINYCSLLTFEILPSHVVVSIVSVDRLDDIKLQYHGF